MKDWKIILWLILFNPVGLYKMYKKSDWSDRTKYIVTVLVGLADVALFYFGGLFYGLFYSSIFIFMMGLISLIMNLYRKTEKKSSIAIIIASIFLFGFSTYQVDAIETRQAAIEEQQRQELLEKEKKEEQRLQIEEATIAVEEAERSKTRDRYIKANSLMQKMNFEHPEILKLTNRLEVLDSFLTKEENFKKAKLALEKAEENQTEENYEAAVSLMNEIDLEGTDFEERLALVKEVVDADNLTKEEIITALEEAEENKDRESYDRAGILLAGLIVSDSNLTNQLSEVEEVIIAEEERVAAEQAEEERLAAEQAEKERVAAEQAENERVASEKVAQESISAQQSSAPANTQTPEVDAENSRTVYVTRTGKKYHSRSNCKGLNASKSTTPATKGEAIGRGLEPCSICW